MPQPDSSPQPTPPGPRRLVPRFSIRALVMATAVLCVAASGLYYARRAVELGFPVELMLVLAVVAAPSVLLIALQVGNWIFKWLDDRTK